MESVKWILEKPSEIPAYLLDFADRPSCPECGTLTNVHEYSDPTTKIGLNGSYQVRYKSYKCSNKTCSNYKGKRFTPPNNRCAPNHHFDYEVEAKTCEIRFKDFKNIEEIESYLFLVFNMKISTSTIAKIIYRYEIASKHENETIILEKIKKNGGTIICIDALHPYIGASMLLVAMDYETGRSIYVEKVKTQKLEVQKAFQKKLKNLMEDHKIPVLGIMSDDNVPQRNAIKEVWGEEVPHCSCLYHFYKQILEKPLELHSKLIKNIRKALRDIHWVELFRRGELQMEENLATSQYLKTFIEDLFILTRWKPGRNNFHLDATKYYERINFYHTELKEFQHGINANDFSLSKQEVRMLPKLIIRLKDILEKNRELFEELTSISCSLEEIKKILDDSMKPEDDGLKILGMIALKLQRRNLAGKILGKYESHFIKEFENFISDRGQTLFNYLRVNERYLKFNKKIMKKINNLNSKEEILRIQNEIHVPRTNNSLESLFKLLRYNIKRTLGQYHANRYLLTHGEYLLHVDIHASASKIKEILQNANYNRISKEIDRQTTPRLTRFSRIRDDDLFVSIKDEYNKMRAILFTN